MTDVALTALQLPDFGMPTVEPRIPAGVFQARCAAALERAASAGFDVLVIYGDREHFANIAYLTNYDPRFEEALLILRAGHKPTLLVGNEGWSYANIVPYEINVILYQSFSLLAQPRGDSLSLAEIFDLCGIGANTRVGVTGWKYFDERETDTPNLWLEVPSYLVDTLRQLTGDSRRVVNATSLFMNPADGLRIINEVDQLAAFEYAACHSSQSVRNVIFGLKAGMTEYEAVRLMQLNGIPHSVTLMLSSGERTSLGLASPSSRVIQQGDPFVTAFGLWGALNCRAGFVVKDADELPKNIHDYVDKLVTPYFRAVAEWYETVGIGVTGGDLFAIINKHIGDPFFGVSLNPGHYTHLDEWVNSPIFAGSTIPLKSGMAIQVDVIPATGTPYFTSNIEDGIALADAALRASFEKLYPETWARIQARRRFMQESLGITLKPEILPLSNIPAYLPPYLLSPHMAMAIR